MKNIKYDLIADCHNAKENKVWNAIVAFVVGGFIGLIGEGIIELLCLNFSLSRNDASTFMIVIYIFVGSFCTALGFFDKLVTICRCGLLIPITGFALVVLWIIKERDQYMELVQICLNLQVLLFYMELFLHGFLE